MLGQIVEHPRYGRGRVTAFDPPRIEVVFDSDPALPRRFSYPAVVDKFLRFEAEDAARRAHEDLEASTALLRRQELARIEENRRREEQIAEKRVEALRKKRSDAAKKAAERRKTALAAKSATEK